jgi:hypothetical protein
MTENHWLTLLVPPIFVVNVCCVSSDKVRYVGVKKDIVENLGSGNMK